jgi:hypothetical protein
MPPDTIETFEVKEDAAGTVAALPTREEAKAQGLTASELDSAEKRGMLAKPEDEATKAKAEADAKTKADAEAQAKADEIAKAHGAPKSSLPDFTFKTPEQEKAFLDAFGAGTPQRAMYFRMKNERQARQSAEQERDKERKDREALEARIKILEGTKTQELDELGNPIDPEDKPLTLKQLREIQKQEADAIESRNKENDSRARVVADAQQNQEEYMKAEHPDFDDAVKLTKDLIQNLDSLVTEEWEKEEIISHIRALQVAAVQADKIDLNRNHAARIAYRIAKYHPNYGKKAEQEGDGSPSENGKPKDPKKANGGLTPEQMKRIEDNTHRRASSASVQGGGGTRTISAEDVDAETLDKMSYSARQKFREKHPDRYAKLLRG